MLFYSLNTENGRELNSEKPNEPQQVLEPSAPNAQKIIFECEDDMHCAVDKLQAFSKMNKTKKKLLKPFIN